MNREQTINFIWEDACRLGKEEYDLVVNTMHFDAPVEDDTYESYSIERLQDMAMDNDPNAQFHLANKYSKVGLFDKAIYWFEMAANNGFIPAMEALGLAYYEGLCGSVDKEKAVYWLKKAASIHCSYLDAEYLGRYYSCEGERIVYETMLEAYKWMFISSLLLQPGPERRARVEQIILWLDMYVKLSFELGYSKQRIINFETVEKYAKLEYYYMGVAKDMGTPDDDPDIPAGSHALRCIGEAARICEKSYSDDVIRAAFEGGDAAAALLLVPKQFESAIDCLQYNNPNLAKKCVEGYLPLIEKLVVDPYYADSYYQAKAYYYLGLAHTLGLGKMQNAQKAHDYLEKASKMNYTKADAVLRQYFKKTLFGWKLIVR